MHFGLHVTQITLNGGKSVQEALLNCGIYLKATDTGCKLFQQQLLQFLWGDSRQTL